jgi:uncharacterized protein HemY
MENNLEVIWTLVDAYRRSADDLEADARRLGGDRPEPVFVEIDKIQAYKDIVEALEGARDTLEDVAKQEGKPREPLKFASKCHVHSKQCDRALEGLLKVGEL